LNTSWLSNISRGWWFTYCSSLTGLRCLCVFSVHHEAFNILASLFQIADLNISLTFNKRAYCLCEIHIMLPSVSLNVDVGTNTSRALNTGRGSDLIVLIQAGASIRRNMVIVAD